jgi:hypothetical protein
VEYSPSFTQRITYVIHTSVADAKNALVSLDTPSNSSAIQILR